MILLHHGQLDLWPRVVWLSLKACISTVMAFMHLTTTSAVQAFIQDDRLYDSLVSIPMIEELVICSSAPSPQCDIEIDFISLRLSFGNVVGFAF